MNAKYRGRAVVLVVLLGVLASAPLLIGAALPADYVRSDLTQSGDIYKQYQWVQRQVEAGEDAEWDSLPALRGRDFPVLKRSITIESGEAHQQYQEALKLMEQSIQDAIPNPDGKGKVNPRLIPPADYYGQYIWALDLMEKSIQEAVPK